jgi:hypothetical protein
MTTTLLGGFDGFTKVLSKESVVVESESCGRVTPLPVRETCGLTSEVVAVTTVRVCVWFELFEVGVNETVTVRALPGGRVSGVVNVVV